MKAVAKRSFWARIVMVLAVLCMSLGFMACDRPVVQSDFEYKVNVSGTTVSVSITAIRDINDLTLKFKTEGDVKVVDYGDIEAGQTVTKSATMNVSGYSAVVYIEVVSGTTKLM